MVGLVGLGYRRAARVGANAVVGVGGRRAQRRRPAYRPVGQTAVGSRSKTAYATPAENAVAVGQVWRAVVWRRRVAERKTASFGLRFADQTATRSARAKRVGERGGKQTGRCACLARQSVVTRRRIADTTTAPNVRRVNVITDGALAAARRQTLVRQTNVAQRPSSRQNSVGLSFVAPQRCFGFVAKLCKSPTDTSGSIFLICFTVGVWFFGAFGRRFGSF